VVYVAIAVCVICFGANAVLSVRRKVRQGRESTEAPSPAASTPDLSRNPVRAPG
jgi:hypothetical protein